MSRDAEPAHVLLFPYLCIGDRLEFGPYELIPRTALAGDDFAAPELENEVAGLLEMYELRSSVAKSFGTVVRHRDGLIGEPFEREEMTPLHRTVVAAILDRIPHALEQKPDAQGWSIPTSDNALLYLHQLDGSGHVAVDYGRMVRTMVGGLTIGEEHSRIYSPSELHAPLLSADPDPVYLTALYSELAVGDPEARRLGRAIEWLDLAWRNTTSIDDDTRILALYSGFEVLLDKEGALELGAELSDLLDATAVKAIRPIPRRRPGNRSDFQPRGVSPLEWWFVFFAFLRHDVSHGEEISQRQYEWNDQVHLFLSESYLRQAIKRKVANAGHSAVLLDPFERIAAEYAPKIVEASSAQT